MAIFSRTIAIHSTSCALACAALCACIVAHAADGIQFQGVIDSFAGSIKRSSDVRRLAAVGSGGMVTPWWGIHGSEDLGSGVKAVFQLEQFSQPDTGRAGRNPTDPGGFSRSGWVGLSGAFGQLSLGRHTSAYFVSMQMVNPFVASVMFSPLVVQSYMPAFNNTVIGDTVWSNVIQYAAPDVHGLGTTLVLATGEAEGASTIGRAGIHLRYRRGALNAVLSGQRLRPTAAAPDGQRAWLAGAAFDAGWAKLYAAAQTTHDDNSADARTWQLGAAVPAGGNGAILAAWARTTGANVAGRIGMHDTAALGYDYTLSRRTDVYAIYLYDHAAGRPRGNSCGVGIRHAF
nr:porin [uncultured Massilia sp.]